MAIRALNKQYISDIVVFLTAGHGGMVAGEYTTPEKDWKKHQFEDGSTIFEGEFNRTLKCLVMFYLHQLGIKYLDIDPEQEFITRSTRIQRINEAYKKYPKAIHLDLHANAFDIENQATGIEIWVANKPSPKSQEMAKCLEVEYKAMMSAPNLQLPKLPFRGIKNKDWDMVAKTSTPSVLVECPFMTTEKECKAWLMSLEGRIQLAKWVSSSIMEYIKKQ